MNKRIFVAKRPQFDFYSNQTTNELKDLVSFQSVQVFLIYDLYNFSEKDSDLLNSVLIDSVTDSLIDKFSFDSNKTYLSIENLPGQYDQRADSAEQCFQLRGNQEIKVQSAFLYEFDGLNPSDFELVKQQLINPIECREKDLSVLELSKTGEIKDVPIIEGFVEQNQKENQQTHKEFGFSFGLDDLEFIQSHFKSINRNPTETELKVLDTYWSDHCRHTTFETEITKVEFDSRFNQVLQNTYNKYLKIREELNITKPIRLMDMATIMGKYLIKNGTINNVEISEEVNACSIEIQVDEDGKTEPWLLMFKNETHNHPTEVEPYGGASTCIGGAIRDPLSGRAFVYQVMRITGSANPKEKIEDTLEGKLPQKKITLGAAAGYSAYGNQIGVSTTLVKEVYHEGYKAKRMEVGFVMGAVKKDWVRRETPKTGDKIILLGGKTGRDGIGGATGSSKVHDGQKLSDLSAEVQKGNAPVERKIQRLFKREEAIRLIKKCNDFGAGGVSVAIGEIADGVKINLNVIPTKYQGLYGTELAISESQERMAVVVENNDVELFIKLSEEENLEAVEVAEVTDDNTMTVLWRNEKIVELDRDFLNTNGVRKQTQVAVTDSNKENPFEPKNFTKESYLELLSDLNHCSQKGLIQWFDCNVGRSTVLAPLGGKFQDSPEDVSVQKLPTKGFTNTVGMSSYGFNPKVSEWNPYFGAYYAVIDSVAKIAAAGGNYADIRLTFQEYFERLRNEPTRWGKPFAALLGALEAQLQLKIAAIGGKDSMSGSYQDIDVPPTLISFAVAQNHTKKIKSSTLQNTDSQLYIFIPPMNENYLLNDSILKSGYEFLYENSAILSAKAVALGGVSECITLMAMGNEIGFELNTNIGLMTYFPGAIVFEIANELEIPTKLNGHIHHLGKTTTLNSWKFNDLSFEIQTTKEIWKTPLQSVFPEVVEEKTVSKSFEIQNQPEIKKPKYHKTVENPKVVIPVFPGTNSEYDSEKAFEKEGAIVEQILIRNLNTEWIEDSINKFANAIDSSEILFIPGGFSAADEPDGSGKFIASFLRNEKVKNSVHELLERGGLILGICNGFQALVKSGLLPYGKITDLNEDSPILFHNTIGRHVAQLAKVKVENDWSPWLNGMKDKTFTIPVSHGEGQFMANDTVIQNLVNQNQIATQYVDLEGDLAFETPYNPNGSVFGIEGITSPCGQIYGRMAHPERVEDGLFKNIPDLEVMNIFKNAVEYFRK